MKYKKIISLLLSFSIIVALAAGCGENKQASDGVGNDYTSLIDNADDSSELPDYTGDTLTLRYWNAHGVKSAYTPYENDVVMPEIERVTGIKIDEENSFDNGTGQTFDTRLGFLTMAKDFPELILCCKNTKLLVDKGLIWDLTDYIEKYCPHIMKKIPKSMKSVWNDSQINGGSEGKVYGIPAMIVENGLLQQDSSVDINDYVWFRTPSASKGYVWIREDILKMLYPTAKTNEELKEMYMSRDGGFTEEEIFDVPINSKQDFMDMLYKIKELGIKENGVEIYPTYLYNGVDNWYLMNNLSGYLDGRGAKNDYFTYYDKITGKVEAGFKSDETVANLKLWNKALKDGLAPQESLVDSAQIFGEKLTNGQYAVSYSYQNPNTMPGQKYQYRKVYLNIPNNTERYYEYADVIKSVLPISIFKGQVDEKQLIQILKYIDFMVSDVGEKLIGWGPKTSGLWEEKDGKRHFLDKELENFMVYNKSSDKAKSYGLENGLDGTTKFVPTYIRGGKGKFAPAVWYDRERNPEDYLTYFNLGLVETDFKPIEAYNAFITNFSCESADKAWQARKAFEDAMLKILTAADDAQFDKLYSDFLKTADMSGYNDKMLEDMNKEFWEINKDCSEQFKR